MKYVIGILMGMVMTGCATNGRFTEGFIRGYNGGRLQETPKTVFCQTDSYTNQTVCH